MDAPPGPTGRILALTVCYEVDGPESPQQVMIDLAQMQQHCRQERLEDLADDLAVLCQDVEAARQPEDSGHPVLGVIRGHR